MSCNADQFIIQSTAETTRASMTLTLGTHLESFGFVMTPIKCKYFNGNLFIQKVVQNVKKRTDDDHLIQALTLDIVATKLVQIKPVLIIHIN